MVKWFFKINSLNKCMQQAMSKNELKKENQTK